MKHKRTHHHVLTSPRPSPSRGGGKFSVENALFIDCIQPPIPTAAAEQSDALLIPAYAPLPGGRGKTEHAWSIGARVLDDVDRLVSTPPQDKYWLMTFMQMLRTNVYSAPLLW